MTQQVVAGILHDDGCVLIGRRSKISALSGWWEFPGGKIETGENAHQALKRELFEELSIAVNTVSECIGTQQNGKVIVQFYHIYNWQGGIQTNVHSELAWVPVANLHNWKTLTNNKDIIDMLQNRYKAVI